MSGKIVSDATRTAEPDLEPNRDDHDRSLLEFIRQHPRLFVLTGAGCSTGSGLADYRDQQGNWKRSQPITGLTFVSDYDARKRYWARSYVGWQAFRSAQPSAAHHALVELQRRGTVRHLVTQNVDKMHQKAGHRQVLDLHGAIDRVSCVSCDRTISRECFQAQLLAENPWLDGLNAEHAPDGDADLEIGPLTQMNIPGCSICSGLMKPTVVFFGENVPRDAVELAMKQLRSADALLVAGSSLMVFSGYRFCRDAAARHQPIVIVNNGMTRADDLAVLKIVGDCGQRLQNVADAI